MYERFTCILLCEFYRQGNAEGIYKILIKFRKSEDCELSVIEWFKFLIIVFFFSNTSFEIIWFLYVRKYLFKPFSRITDVNNKIMVISKKQTLFTIPPS